MESGKTNKDNERASGADVVKLLRLGYKREDLPGNLTKAEAERMAAARPHGRGKSLSPVWTVGLISAVLIGTILLVWSQDSSDTSSEQQTKFEKQTQEELERMEAVLNLSELEKANLEKAFITSNDAFIQWRDTKGKELNKLKGKVEKFSKTRNVSGALKSIDQAAPAFKSMNQIMKQHRILVRDALSPSNQIAWNAHQVSEELLKYMDQLALTEKQLEQIHEVSMVQASESNNKKRPLLTAFNGLEKQVEKTVLTSEQRQAYKDIKEANPLRNIFLFL